jgi:hypothetical protein
MHRAAGAANVRAGSAGRAAAPLVAFSQLPEQPELERSERDHGNEDEDDRQEHQDTSALCVFGAGVRRRAGDSPTNATVRRGDGEHSVARTPRARYG